MTTIFIKTQKNFKNSLNFYDTGACPAETTGDNVTQGLFFWNRTAGNISISTACPYGERNAYNNKDLGSLSGAYRTCRCEDFKCQKPYWLAPDISNCNYRLYNESTTAAALSNLYQVW